jgi:NAD(P)H-dependent flavin oxidoreductase YrpB (nitropropane dioxygenase family)
MLHTPLCDLLGIEHAIMQAGMARIYTNAELVAAVSNAGGLGVLGCLWRPTGDTVASDLFDILWGDNWPGVRARAIRNAFVERWLGRENELRGAIDDVRSM